VEGGDGFCWDIPSDGAVYNAKGTFAFVSLKAINELRQKGSFVYDDITWRTCGETADTLRVRADIDQTEMTISYVAELGLYLVKEMKNNPLGIDWKI